jgi:hypothetical protein
MRDVMSFLLFFNSLRGIFLWLPNIFGVQSARGCYARQNPTAINQAFP